MTAGAYVLAWHHATHLYLDVSAYGWPYFCFSLVAMLFLHDAYFYWSHRLSHASKVMFRRFHRIHHQSLNPTPYADIMFHPVDALVHAGFIPLFLFTLPVHPLALGLFLATVTVVNAVGHIGYEIFPYHWLSRPGLRWISQATSHNLHHSKVHCNYGLYFRFWDKLCGTYHPETDELFRRCAPDTAGLPPPSAPALELPHAS
jgi:sterol desaturase/sphingolipid hydroxylase (fatty acid hydroxylase superfamily)